MDRKIAIVTGASRGLGRSAALHLSAQGVDIIGTYHTRLLEAQSLVAEIKALGGRVTMLQLDISKTSRFGLFREKVAAALRTIFAADRFDYLVNNAGIGIAAAYAETTEDQFDSMMDINLKGPFFLTQSLLPLISDNGRIVNISTDLTRFCFPGFAAYATMKGAIEVMTRYQAKELGQRGISVNSLAPGATATDFGGGMIRDTPEVNKHVAATTALGRVGLADDIGGAIAALLSENNHWVTGQRIEASGGHEI